MRLIIVFTLLFSTGLALANSGRTFKCNALNDIDQQSIFEINIDTGVIKMKDVQAAHADWLTLYSEDISCTHHNTTSVTCTRQLRHNFNDPDSSYKAITDSIRCVRPGGKPLIHLNGDLEINRFGDGTGTFACGTLTKYKLMLEGCKVTQ
ncbi:MAG: hypothetical protein A2381_00515 [Bdellovibrionales bacterium RIFOXYB1_FULL_37_110]|nr:MAG: hypothetical protein A2417_11570 [Bdellovibrionales bacterium RIFOXYC1_FULL_37_79]OFZ60876.1 MAG: hypothetical protein A2381_00515 [Bdellovibrionales bacterium RIFOXYB1_FULL_37_110]OFZ62406.1 MAG: hypothetical protein A2577_03180 [Bdellovibrionales bacterium RIFOXYD1_FULL_36_51]